MDNVSREKFGVRALCKPLLIIILAPVVIGVLARFLVVAPLFIFFAFKSGNMSQAIDSAMFYVNTMWGRTLCNLLQNSGYVLIVLIFLMGSKLPVLDRLSMGHLRDAPKLFFAGVGLDLVTFLLPVGVGILFGIVTIQEYGLTNSGVTGVALSTVLVAIGTLSVGIGEEVLFRGYIQRTLSDRYGIALALPVAATMFAMVHIPYIIMGGVQSPLTIVTIFVTALMLGYLFYKTGSLWVCIGWHFTTDFLNTQFISGMSGYAPFFTISQETPVIPSAPWLGDWINIIITCVYIIVLLLIVLYYHNSSPAKPGTVPTGPS